MAEDTKQEAVETVGKVYSEVLTDPILQFIFDEETSSVIYEIGNAGPWSRISSSRIGIVGYNLVRKRLLDLGQPDPGSKVYVRGFMESLKEAVLNERL